MAFDFFELGIQSGLSQNPNEKIREQQQASIDSKWDVTTAKYTIKEQDDFGLKTYHDIEVWIDYVVGMTSRGLANGDDFRHLYFRDINHPVERGLYYRFDEAVWLCYFTDEYASLEKDIGVRRCNNALRMIDPENGALFSVPCIIDYDMSSPSQQVNRYVITPNNHATIMVQGNPDTIRLFKLNTRFILGGRPFKLLAYQNALIDKELATYPTLLYLDLYLDEIHAQDDIANQIAYNGDYNYAVSIDSADLELTENSQGTLNASVTLNGEEVNRKISWTSSNPKTVFIAENGKYIVKGKVDETCTITANIVGNELSKDTINIKIVDTATLKPKLIIEPSFDKIRQYETIEFTVMASYGDKLYVPESAITLDKDNIYFSIVEKSSGKYSITGQKVAKKPQLLYINLHNINPAFDMETTYPIEAVSMMG